MKAILHIIENTCGTVTKYHIKNRENKIMTWLWTEINTE